MKIIFEIIEKKRIAPGIHRLVILAPLVANKAQAGNFVIIRVGESGERIPITIAGHDPLAGTITLVIQAVGKSTKIIGELKRGDTLLDVLGPLGTAPKIGEVEQMIAICGGIGVVPTLPLLRAFRSKGAKIVTIMGARTKELLILQKEVEEVSDEVIYVTDDGSFGVKGLVTNPLLELLQAGRHFEQAIAIGPARMMQATCEITARYKLPTTVSLNAVMVDGTGMCGACRVTVGGKLKFTCVDGPNFDGHVVNFDELILRQAFYKDEEHRGKECTCGEQ